MRVCVCVCVYVCVRVCVCFYLSVESNTSKIGGLILTVVSVWNTKLPRWRLLSDSAQARFDLTYLGTQFFTLTFQSKLVLLQTAWVPPCNWFIHLVCRTKSQAMTLCESQDSCWTMLVCTVTKERLSDMINIAYRMSPTPKKSMWSDKITLSIWRSHGTIYWLGEV